MLRRRRPCPHRMGTPFWHRVSRDRAKHRCHTGSADSTHARARRRRSSLPPEVTPRNILRPEPQSLIDPVVDDPVAVYMSKWSRHRLESGSMPQRRRDSRPRHGDHQPTGRRPLTAGPKSRSPFSAVDLGRAQRPEQFICPHRAADHPNEKPLQRLDLRRVSTDSAGLVLGLPVDGACETRNLLPGG
jgi:hypothetical protein